MRNLNGLIYIHLSLTFSWKCDHKFLFNFFFSLKQLFFGSFEKQEKYYFALKASGELQKKNDRNEMEKCQMEGKLYAQSRRVPAYLTRRSYTAAEHLT